MRIQRCTGWGVGTILAAAICLGAENSAIVEAAKNRDKAALRSLLAHKADARIAEADGTTALHWAAHWADMEMLDLLLKAGADVKAENRYGVTPLAELLTDGSAAMIEKLLQAGADPNTLTTAEGETVLMTASRLGNAEAVKVLLDHGANPNTKESYKGQTALMWAAAEGHADVIQLLLAKGADPKAVSTYRDTTLPRLAAATPPTPVSRGGLTALLFGAREGHIGAVNALLDGGADINQQDVDGNNALQLAILNVHYDLAEVLLERGADPSLANKGGRAALYMAVDVRDADWSPRPARPETDKTSSLDLIKSLLAHGANANQQLTSTAEIPKTAQDHGDRTMAEGATPFLRAARSADTVAMRLLVEKGADPRLSNKNGLTALLVAAGVGWSDKIQGTEAEALEAVKLCVALGLDLNAINDLGETAMHGAANRSATSVIKYLADKGVKLDLKDKRAHTPFDIANGKGGTPQGTPREPNPAVMAVLKELLLGKSSATAGLVTAGGLNEKREEK